MVSLKRLFFWLSGAGTECLESCPNWEQRKYVAFGATVLVPTVFAFIACSYALSTLTDNWRIVYLVALVWAFIILTIDRALLASYRPYLSWTRRLSQFGLRCVVALLMGLTISHPLALMLFQDTVQSEIERNRESEIVEVRRQSQMEKDTMRDKLEAVDAEIAAKREAWNRTFDAEFLAKQSEGNSDVPVTPGSETEQAAQAALTERIEEKAEPFRQKLTIVETEMESLNADYTKLQAELDFWQKEFEREVNGQRSGIVGLGPRAKSIQSDQLSWRRDEAKRLSGLLEHLTNERTRLRGEITAVGAVLTQEFESEIASAKAADKAEEARLAALKHQVQQEQADQFVEQQNQQRASLTKEIDAKLEESGRIREEIAQVNEDERQRIAAIRADPRNGILTQTLALHHLFRKGEEGGRFALIAYAVLTLLFMLVDTIPLVVKFFAKPGPYDTLLDQDEVRFDREREAFLASFGRFMANEAQAETPYYARGTRHKPLESALTEGVERSRAAKQFLESLMEMERAFEQRMQVERERAATEGKTLSPERIAMLEDMANTFYRDLRKRMESFFQEKHPRGALPS